MGRFPPRSYNVDSRGIRDLTGARERKKVSDRGTDPCGCLHVRELSLTAGNGDVSSWSKRPESEFRIFATQQIIAKLIVISVIFDLKFEDRTTRPNSKKLQLDYNWNISSHVHCILLYMRVINITVWFHNLTRESRYARWSRKFKKDRGVSLPAFRGEKKKERRDASEIAIERLWRSEQKRYRARYNNRTLSRWNWSRAR